MKYLVFLWLLLLSFLSILSCIDHCVVSGQCLQDQKSLLLQLKQGISFSPYPFCSTDECGFLSPSNLTSWNTSTDCCSSWDGIKCDGSGHVIGLDLYSKSITGVRNWTTLFELKYLESLNLSYNYFYLSSIPSGFDKLANLTHLNLSYAGFSGQIPIEISRLKRLVSLDLSALDSFPLKLENPNLTEFVRDLSELRELYLDGVNISMHGTEWSQALSSALPHLQQLSLPDCQLSRPFDPSLLELRSLSKLQLDFNNISDTVPEFLGNFSNLSFLSLSACELQGKFPKEIFQMSQLQSLYVSGNPRLQGYLPEFPINGRLENLVLSTTNFSGTLPESIGNLRFLYMFVISYCSFTGSIPTSISNLTQLHYLYLSDNNFTGSIPNMLLSVNLTIINFANNRFSGTISSSQWGGFENLVSLSFRNNSLDGTVPTTLFSLPLLQRLDLSQNQFSGSIPTSISNLTHLQFLDLSGNSLNGTLPPTLFSLPLLQDLDLSQNRFTGQLGQFPNRSSLLLQSLDVSNNMLQGSVPSSISSLSNLEDLALSSNNLSGTLELDWFHNLKSLSSLDLSGNKLSINHNVTNSSSFPQLNTLILNSCNLKTFPQFLSNQSMLSTLDLSNNEIHGKIPNWIGKIGNGGLVNLNLSLNKLESPDQPLSKDAFMLLSSVDLHSNLLQGSIPILPPSAIVLDYSNNKISSAIPENISLYLNSAIFFSLSNNYFKGVIPSSICKAQSLQILDLSNNNLDGSIPTCLGGNSNLLVLNLRSNKLSGIIPANVSRECSLRTLDLNGNRLDGEVPMSLANCKMLEVLDLGNNQIHGSFPWWLGEMLDLRVLVLRSNKFTGSIPHSDKSNRFSMLQIIDLSSNKFTGSLPSTQFFLWEGMMAREEADSNYKQDTLKVWVEGSRLYYQDAVTVTSKGHQMTLVKILTIFTSIDLSNNRFEGEIPEQIGKLTALYVLNLSSNAFSGSVLRSLGKLKHLESLDLSRNKLSGVIPSELGDLTFLSVLDLSSNQLSGLIPQGRQFQTFDENAFENNSGLCGRPVSEFCTNNTVLNLPIPSTDMCKLLSLSNNCPGGGKRNWLLIISALGWGVGVGLAACLAAFWQPWNRLCIFISKSFLKMD